MLPHFGKFWWFFKYPLYKYESMISNYQCNVFSYPSIHDIQPSKYPWYHKKVVSTHPYLKLHNWGHTNAEIDMKKSFQQSQIHLCRSCVRSFQVDKFHKFILYRFTHVELTPQLRNLITRLTLISTVHPDNKL